MTKEITVQELKEHFDEQIAEVKSGTTLRVMDGQKVVAEIKPKTTDDLIYRRATKSWKDFVPPPPIEADIDVVALLREDRDSR